jgi:hypothetical protein
MLGWRRIGLRRNEVRRFFWIASLGLAFLGGWMLVGLLVGAQEPAPASTQPATSQAGALPRDDTAEGARSPRNANYSIDVRLDHETRTLTGREVITWRNITSRATSVLQFHLYYNAWKNTGSTWMRERLLAGDPGRLTRRRPEDWGWSEVTGVRLLGEGAEPFVDVTGERRYIAPDDGNTLDQTVMEVRLPQPVAGGETLRIEVAWTAKVPRTFARTGVIDDFYFIAQWFPKLGVLEESGWNCHQFHSGTEFYSDYGIYDVRITVPRAWVVGATGRERRRTDNPDGTTTHEYSEADVHDFAWTTSPVYVERRARFEHPTLPAVDMRLLLQPEHAQQAERHFDATRATLRYYGEWFGAYPYGHITVIDPAFQSGAGGMEYPTLFTAGSRLFAPRGVTTPEGVTIHEAGHQFWYGIVGNNEFEHAWLDEGLNTFSTARVIGEVYQPNFTVRRYFGGLIPYVFRDIPVSRETGGNRLNSYRPNAEIDALATPTFRLWPSGGGNITYDKTALMLHTMERMLGWETLQRILSTFFERWKFKHPRPDDFFAIANEVSGQDLTWFFDQAYRTSNVFDYGIQQLTSEVAGGTGFFDRGGERRFERPTGTPTMYRTRVVVRRYGEATFPVDVLVVFQNGERVVERWNGADRWTMFTFERSSRAAYAHVDPERKLLLDVNYTNNSRALAPRATEASTKWMLKWLVWLQDRLLTGAFLL